MRQQRITVSITVSRRRAVGPVSWTTQLGSVLLSQILGRLSLTPRWRLWKAACIPFVKYLLGIC